MAASQGEAAHTGPLHSPTVGSHSNRRSGGSLHDRGNTYTSEARYAHFQTEETVPTICTTFETKLPDMRQPERRAV
jgi:hypothetical protein